MVAFFVFVIPLLATSVNLQHLGSSISLPSVDGQAVISQLAGFDEDEQFDISFHFGLGKVFSSEVVAEFVVFV